MDTAHAAAVITGRVDTHKDTHTAAALDATGRQLGTQAFKANAEGYAALVAWLRAFGTIHRVGIEGTGPYGAGLTRYLREQRIDLVEVNRPNRQTRRRHGKSDPADAEAAARATLSGDALGLPKSQDGSVEVMRILRLQRRSAIRARTQAANQLHAVVTTAPEPLRSAVRDLSLTALIAYARKLRPGAPADLTAGTQVVLRGLARRWLYLDQEVDLLDEQLEVLVKATAPS